MDITPQQRLTEYLNACESLDAERIASCFSKDAVVLDPDGGVQGKDGIAAYFVRIYAPLSKLELRTRPIYWCGAGAACEWSGKAEYHDGRLVEYRGIDTFEFDDERLISRMVAYWDTASLPQ